MELKKELKCRLFAVKGGLELLKDMNVSAASRVCLELIALAFLADVADVRRFRTLLKMNAYLRLVPRASNSGGKDRPGHITRESRKLTRTILTQCVHHVAASSVSLDCYCHELREKLGTGRARIAVIRKLKTGGLTVITVDARS